MQGQQRAEGEEGKGREVALTPQAAPASWVNGGKKVGTLWAQACSDYVQSDVPILSVPRDQILPMCTLYNHHAVQDNISIPQNVPSGTVAFHTVLAQRAHTPRGDEIIYPGATSIHFISSSSVFLFVCTL